MLPLPLLWVCVSVGNGTGDDGHRGDGTGDGARDDTRDEAREGAAENGTGDGARVGAGDSRHPGR